MFAPVPENKSRRLCLLPFPAWISSVVDHLASCMATYSSATDRLNWKLMQIWNNSMKAVQDLRTLLYPKSVDPSRRTKQSAARSHQLSACPVRPATLHVGLAETSEHSPTLPCNSRRSLMYNAHSVSAPATFTGIRDHTRRCTLSPHDLVSCT